MWLPSMSRKVVLVVALCVYSSIQLSLRLTAETVAETFPECPLLSSKLRLSNTAGRDQHTAAICAVARGESRYLDEWLTYQRAVLGFSDIVLFDNDYLILDNRVKSPLGIKYGRCPGIHVIPWPLMVLPQWPAYGKCVQILRTNEELKNVKWVGFFDIDEFIVLKRDETIVDILTELLPGTERKMGLIAASLAINWVVFGSSNHTHYQDKPVTFRFRHQIGPNKHVKTISLLEAIERPGVHFAENFTSSKHRAVSSTGNITKGGAFNRNGPMDRIVINHYWQKSEEEFRYKGCKRGRPTIRTNDPQNYVNCNQTVVPGEIYDDSAWKLLTKFVPEYAVRYGP